MKYAGFWPRLAAGIIDGLIYSPFMWLSLTLMDGSRMAHLYLEPSQLVLMALNLWLVYRFGGSLGKLAMGLRIRMLDGAPITLRATCLRYSVDWILTITMIAGTVIGVLRTTDAQFVGLSLMEQFDLLEANGPPWNGVLSIVFGVWYWGELIVMLTNKKRRALHDFLAGTVVIKLERESVPAREPLVAE
jgi:uncharacterized RDD family membrane protein YckC